MDGDELLIALDDEGARWATHAGVPWVAFEACATDDVDRAQTLVLGPSSLVQLRGLRATGNRVPAVLVGMAPDRRAELEPVAVVSDDDNAMQVLAELTERSSVGAVRVAGGVVDLQRRCLLRGDTRTVMTQLQVDLLAYLAHRADRPIPRDELLVHVWGMSAKSRTRTVDMAVSRLRKLVEADPLDPAILLTCQGSGYRYVPPAEPLPIEAPLNLIGRDGLFIELGRLVDSQGLVVVHGPPGVGKSRLVQALAGQRGAQRVSLGGSNDVLVQASTVAASLGVGVPEQDSAEDVWQRVFSTAPPDWLLVIDDADPSCLPLLQAAHGDVTVVVVMQAASGFSGPSLRVPPLNVPASMELLRARGVAATDEAMAEVVAAVGGLPLALEVAAGRMALLGGRASTHDLLGASGDGPLPRAIRAAADGLLPTVREALVAMCLGRAPMTVHDLKQLLGRRAVEDWVQLHASGLLQVEKGDGRALAPVAAVLRDDASADLIARYRSWLAETVHGLGEQLGGPSARDAIGRLHQLEHDAWTMVDVDPSTLDAAQTAVVLDELAEWQGASKSMRRTRLDGLLQHVGPSPSRGWLLCRRAESTPPVDWESIRNDGQEGLQWLHGAGAARMALRAAATAEWSCDYSGAIELLDGILNTEATGTYRQMAVAHRHYLLARSRQLPLDEAGALLLGDFEQLAADHALRGASSVATRALTILRVAGTTPNEELLAFGRRALACAERLGDPIVIATLQVRVTQVLVALDRREETLKAFETADALFSRIDPVRGIQVAAVRGRVLAEWGDHAAARLNLKRYLNWSAARGMPTGASDAALWLVSVEGDAGEPERMKAYALQAQQAAEGNDPHLLAHAQLGVAQACLLMGDIKNTASALAAIDREALSPVGIVTIQTCCSVMARLDGQDPPEVDERLLAAVKDRGANYGSAVRRITTAALSGIAPTTEPNDGINVRLLIRTWGAWFEAGDVAPPTV